MPAPESTGAAPLIDSAVLKISNCRMNDSIQCPESRCRAGDSAIARPRRWRPLLLLLACGVTGWNPVTASEGIPKGIDQEIRDPTTNEVLMHAVVVVPPVLPKHRLGLMVLLHGIGGDARFMFGFTNLGMTANKLADDYVWIGLKSKGKGWADSDHPAMEAAIRWALATYPIDPRRVFGYGISHGAMRLSQFAPLHPEWFAACVLMAGNGPILNATRPMCGNEVAQRFYIIHGDQDTIVPLEQDRAYAERLRLIQHSVVLREIAGDGHVLGFQPNEVITPDAFAWLEAQRNRAIPLDAHELVTVQRIAKAVSAGTREGVADFAQLDLLAGSDVEAVVASAAMSPLPALRIAAARFAARRLFGAEVVKPLLALVDDPVAAVRKEAIPAVGQLALWQQQDAVALLVARATDSKQPADVRMACATQLARAWRINLPCSNQEQRFGDALKQLSSDAGGLEKIARKGLEGSVAWFDGAPTIVPPWKPAKAK